MYHRVRAREAIVIELCIHLYVGSRHILRRAFLWGSTPNRHGGVTSLGVTSSGSPRASGNNRLLFFTKAFGPVRAITPKGHMVIELSTEHDERKQRTRPLEGRCCNHFELAFTEFDFLLDFGQAYDQSAGPVMHTRIILNPHSALTLLQMLTDLIARYQSSVGPIERGRT